MILQSWRVIPSGRPERAARLPVTQPEGDTDHCPSLRVPLAYDRPKRCAVLARVAGTPTLVVGWPPRLDGLESDKKKWTVAAANGHAHGYTVSLGRDHNPCALWPASSVAYFSPALVLPVRRARAATPAGASLPTSTPLLFALRCLHFK
jgi:hypothetical protein